MTGSVKNFIDAASRSGLVCQDYMRKIAAAGNKAEMFRVLCDVNGGSWLFDLHANGVQLPIEQFLKEYAAYVNGGKTVEYPGGYTSKFYCKYADKDSEIVADTTFVWLLECKDVKVVVPDNAYPTVTLSDGSSAEITLGKGSRINLETYGTSAAKVHGDNAKVRRVAK